MALSLGQIVVANPNNWLISDGKLFVFGKAAPAGPVLFEKRPRRERRQGKRQPADPAQAIIVNDLGWPLLIIIQWGPTFAARRADLAIEAQAALARLGCGRGQMARFHPTEPIPDG